jgi:hypothetical protein
MIYDIPLYYISFSRKPALEEMLRKVGFIDINHFVAIDGRKMKPIELLLDNVISIRAYNDLIYKRHQHTGISSLGTIGCSLSHLELWKKCASDLDYITIVEDDLILDNLTDIDTKNIQDALTEHNGAFIATKFKTGDELLFGLHFYFLTKGAAQALVLRALPIDLQTDSYVGNLNNINLIKAKGYRIGRQSHHVSSTGDVCVKCNISPNLLLSPTIYILIVFIILLIVVLYFLFNCKQSTWRTR